MIKGVALKTKVLAMDDSLTVRSVIESTLKNNGYDVCVVSNGEEGIQKADEISPDVILVDFVMPKMNGYQVCKKLRGEHQFKHTPIILITARGEEVGKTFSEKFNVNYFIKPFRPSELLDKIEEVTKDLRAEGLTTSDILPELPEEIELGEESLPEVSTLAAEEIDLPDLPDENLSRPDIGASPSQSDAPEDLDQLLKGLSTEPSDEPQQDHNDTMAIPEDNASLMQDMDSGLTLDNEEQAEIPSNDVNELKEYSLGSSLDELSLPEGLDGLELPGQEKQEELQLKDFSPAIEDSIPSVKEDENKIDISLNPYTENKSGLGRPDGLLNEDSLAEAAEEQTGENRLELDENELSKINEASVPGEEHMPELEFSDVSLDTQDISSEAHKKQSQAEETLILDKEKLRIEELVDDDQQQGFELEPSDDSLKIEDISSDKASEALSHKQGPGLTLSDETLNLQDISTASELTEEESTDKTAHEAKEETKIDTPSGSTNEITPPSELPEKIIDTKTISPEAREEEINVVKTPSLDISGQIQGKEIASKVSEVVSRYLINYFESNFLERIEQSLTDNIHKHFISNSNVNLPLSGDIANFSLSLAIKLITEAQLKGVLNIFSLGQFAEVYIADGRIVSANSNKKTKWSFIGQVLKKEAKISEEQLAEALEKSIAEKRPLGRVIIEKGFASANDIKSVLKRQVIAVIRSLMELKSGKFFFEATDEEEKFSDMPLNLTMNEIMSYNPATQDEDKVEEPSNDWRHIYQRINGHDVYIGVIGDFNQIRSLGLNPEQLKIYSYLDGEKDLDTIIKISGLSYFDVYKIVYSLIKEGLIKKLTKGE
jgi:CheY-like chemotaxis protein